MDYLEDIRKKGYERVSFFSDTDLDLTAIIAVHSTVLGPGLGGCRFRAYQNINEALNDVLRLSEGMTYKSALAGLNLGGGKSVLIASEKALKNRRAVFLKFGSWVESMGGTYISAEDMGTSLEDVKTMSEVTSHISGSDPKKGGGGDPSPHTAMGVFLGIQACLKRVFDSSDFSSRTVAIQGVGSVGYHLCGLLREAGCRVIVADPNEKNLQRARENFSIEVVPVESIFSTNCDVFSPSAIGGILNSASIPKLNTKIVAGASNNQLAAAADEELLRSRGIIYAPDFAINAGGVIMCADELEVGGFNEARVHERVSKIGDTVFSILEEASSANLLAGEVAIRMAKARIEKRKVL